MENITSPLQDLLADLHSATWYDGQRHQPQPRYRQCDVDALQKLIDGRVRSRLLLQLCYALVGVSRLQPQQDYRLLLMGNHPATPTWFYHWFVEAMASTSHTDLSLSEGEHSLKIITCSAIRYPQGFELYLPQMGVLTALHELLWMVLDRPLQQLVEPLTKPAITEEALFAVKRTLENRLGHWFKQRLGSIHHHRQQVWIQSNLQEQFGHSDLQQINDQQLFTLWQLGSIEPDLGFRNFRSLFLALNRALQQQSERLYPVDFDSCENHLEQSYTVEDDTSPLDRLQQVSGDAVKFLDEKKHSQITLLFEGQWLAARLPLSALRAHYFGGLQSQLSGRIKQQPFSEGLPASLMNRPIDGYEQILDGWQRLVNHLHGGVLASLHLLLHHDSVVALYLLLHLLPAEDAEVLRDQLYGYCAEQDILLEIGAETGLSTSYNSQSEALSHFLQQWKGRCDLHSNGVEQVLKQAAKAFRLIRRRGFMGADLQQPSSKLMMAHEQGAPLALQVMQQLQRTLNRLVQRRSEWDINCANEQARFQREWNHIYGEAEQNRGEGNQTAEMVAEPAVA